MPRASSPEPATQSEARAENPYPAGVCGIRRRLSGRTALNCDAPSGANARARCAIARANRPARTDLCTITCARKTLMDQPLAGAVPCPGEFEPWAWHISDVVLGTAHFTLTMAPATNDGTSASWRSHGSTLDLARLRLGMARQSDVTACFNGEKFKP
jgi:hypothetical protein